MWSGRVHCVYAPGRKIAAENKRDAGQKSAAHQAELDSGLRQSQRSVTDVRLFGANRSVVRGSELSLATDLCLARVVSIAGPPNGLEQEKVLLAQARPLHS
jgi:hypothetical protein